MWKMDCFHKDSELRYQCESKLRFWVNVNEFCNWWKLGKWNLGASRESGICEKSFMAECCRENAQRQLTRRMSIARSSALGLRHIFGYASLRQKRLIRQPLTAIVQEGKRNRNYEEGIPIVFGELKSYRTVSFFGSRDFRKMNFVGKPQCEKIYK